MNDTIISPQQDEACLSSLESIRVEPMFGGMMSNIGEFVKKNAIILGIGALGIGAAIYFMTRKKSKTSKGLSGVSRKTYRNVQKRKAKPKRITAKRLS